MKIERAYRAETPHGIFTRNTTRTYTHVVLARGVNLEKKKKKAADQIAFAEKFSPMVAGALRIKSAAEVLDVERSNPTAPWKAVSWCGSIELAKAARGQQARVHADAIIVPVTHIKEKGADWKALRHSCWTP
jgi:hypothetical protein